KEKLGAPRISLPSGTAAKLVVDSAAFVPLRCKHEQAAGSDCRFLQALYVFAYLFFPFVSFGLCLDIFQFSRDSHVGIATELDVRAPAGHVGGDGNRVRLPGL